MRLDAFMQITDAEAPNTFASSLDKDNLDKVEVLAFRQTIMRALDYRGAATDPPPKSVLLTVLRTVDKDSINLLKRVKDNKVVSVSLFVRAMQLASPAPTPPVPKYDKEYIKIVLHEAHVTRFRISLESQPERFGVFEEIDFTCSSGKVDWKSGSTAVNDQAVITPST
ncbi:MAG TPA: hypothetical protein VKU82_12360 [Planctomycetaceae bacterium]|nr:hypothetical protein [Planctomycetaceae bacterium]